MPVEKRLDKFREVAVPLVTDVCARALKDAGVKAEEIGKLVVVSSTGFLGPGLDCSLIKTLGLARSVDRSLIGFMGCAAAMNGFRVANDSAVAPREIGPDGLRRNSSCAHDVDDNVNDAILHARSSRTAARRPSSVEKPGSAKAKGKFGIADTHGWLVEGTEDGITLSINENGISCILSKYLPQYIAKNMGEPSSPSWACTTSRRATWTSEPSTRRGGRLIEEGAEREGLTEEQASVSIPVLSNYGITCCRRP